MKAGYAGGLILKIKIICVGKIKEKYLIEAISEYSKRLSRYTNLEIIELQDEKTPDNANNSLQELIKNKEGERILKRIEKNDFCIALDIKGKMLSSAEFSSFFSEKMVLGISSFCFIIGGSLGLSNDVLNNVDYKLSFSKMTFPHQLMRVVLLEQIYRSHRILNNEPYHK